MTALGNCRMPVAQLGPGERVVPRTVQKMFGKSTVNVCMGVGVTIGRTAKLQCAGVANEGSPGCYMPLLHMCFWLGSWLLLRSGRIWLCPKVDDLALGGGSGGISAGPRLGCANGCP